MRKIISNNHIFSKLIDVSANVFIVAGICALSGCSISYPLAGLIDNSPTASLTPAASPDKPPSKEASIDMMPTASITPIAKPKTFLVIPNANASLRPDMGMAAAAISPLTLHLQPADLSSARSALNLALNSQSPLQSVAWSNPMTGSSGAFMPVGQETAAQDMICRNFKALVHPTNILTDKKLSGAACKNDSGQWIVMSMDVSQQET